MAQTHRINGGQINRKIEMSFSFDGKTFLGHPGDTLASALLANGQRLVGRSFKYHRPRGIFSAGSEEPNALVELRDGAHLEPNTRATVTELFQGLSARSQNHIGPLWFDLMAVNDWFSPLLSAGFYYKTFMWPRHFWEKIYEPAIRASAGLGRLSMLEDPDTYDKGFLHCDLLIIGGGAAGLISALIAGRAGARVILCDEDFRMGGRLNSESYEIDGQAGADWAATTVDELKTLSNVRIMSRTTVYGSFDHGIYGAVERSTDHLADSGRKPRQVLWRIYSRQAILCAGATERSIAFANNDRPGIMLAGSVRSYVNRWAVTPGYRVAIFTNNDDGWRTAHDLSYKGIVVPVIVDSRDQTALTAPPGTRVIMNGRVTNTSGHLGLKSIRLGNGEKIATDCLAVSGGWNPNLHLSSHQRGLPTWREDIAAFVPGATRPVGMLVAGAAAGEMSLSTVLRSAANAANQCLYNLGLSGSAHSPTNANDPTTENLPPTSDDATAITAFWQVNDSKRRAWVDLQNDVTTKDIRQACQEGYSAVEHLKRYTTLGMATDQGKTANVLGLAILAELTGRNIPDTGSTVFRPPYTPVSIGALAGRSRGKHFRPTRLTPSHEWASENGAAFTEAGNWYRAQWFALPGESGWRDSVDREVVATRSGVGICDVTTLGKIDIQGRDATSFLDKVYANGFASLAVGKVRYGLMLREDGFAMDDGTTARLTETHYLMTTTTAHAVSVYRHLEFCRQCLWPEMDVSLIPVTEQFAQFAIAGPKSRALLTKVVDPAFDITHEAFPYMACGELTICGGVPARLFRISFSGELAYEIAISRRYGDSLMRCLMSAGEEFGVVPYGTEAMGVMRIEKGHPAGNEFNGQTTAEQLGMGRMVSRTKDSIGKVLSMRPAMTQPDNVRMMGFIPINKRETLSNGSHFINVEDPVDMAHDLGWMSSVAFSPTLGHSIGLGFINNGANRVGEVVRSVNPLGDSAVVVKIVPSCFVDPDGERLRV
ncbi:MAG: sarcosine oxidase subunit alpha family protein [Burkholderiaceae bacterium]